MPQSKQHEALCARPLEQCPAYFRRDEAAAYLRISIRSLDRMLARKTLRASKVGGACVVPRSEIRRILEGS